MKANYHRICLITTNHISTNPRLVKEAMALEEEGLEVNIVFSQHSVMHAEEDYRILLQHPAWKYHVRNWTGNTSVSRIKRMFTGIIQKMVSVCQRFSRQPTLPEWILNRNYFFQLKKAESVKADLYIAHNAGALAVAAKAAKQCGADYAFDAEDFHRGEALDPVRLKAVKAVEEKYLPGSVYISAASPLIAQEYEELFPGARITTIRNVFSIPGNNVKLPSSTGTPLKLFWFSQTVGTDRGLQDVFSAIKLAEPHQMELHIYGNITKDVRDQFQNQINQLDLNYSSVIFHQPVSPDKLLEIAETFDIGFASEPGFCRNNEIALSNKVFTYLAGGNAILFSSTPAQKIFYSSHPDTGFLYNPGDSKTLAAHLRLYDRDRELLLQHKITSKRLCLERYNWEKEKEIFLSNFIFKEKPLIREGLLSTGHGV